jgi:hypothetical protein
MADRKISDLTALTTPASGDYVPIVDISEVAAASKNKRITIEELMRGMPDGTAAAPGIAFETDPNTGIYSPGADQLAVSTGGTGRLFVDASGRVGIGTSSPNKLLELASFNDSSAEGNTLRFTDIDGSAAADQQTGRIEFFTSDATQSGVQSFILGAADDFAGNGSLRFGTGLAGSAAERLRITSAGVLQVADAGNITVGTTTGTKIGTATTQKIGFFNATPVVQPTEITDELTSITHTAPGTSDYAVQDLVQNTGFGFVTKDEGNTVLSVILNLQTRVNELETRLATLGLIADAD